MTWGFVSPPVLHTLLFNLYNYNFSALPFELLHPLNVLPPSSSSTFPVICALACELRNNTTPAKSEGFPIRPLGWRSKSVSMYFSTPKFVIRLGKTPGQMQFTVMFWGMSCEEFGKLGLGCGWWGEGWGNVPLKPESWSGGCRLLLRGRRRRFLCLGRRDRLLRGRLRRKS